MGRPPKEDLDPAFAKMIRTVSANVRELRVKQELTQSALAKRAKISPTTLNELESQTCRDIRMSTLFSIAQVLNADMYRLFIESDVDVSARDKETLLRASEDLSRVLSKLDK